MQVQELISAIASMIENIEQAPITAKPNPKLMQAWGDLAEKAIDTITKNPKKREIDLMINFTLSLLEARRNYLKRLEKAKSYNNN